MKIERHQPYVTANGIDLQASRSGTRKDQTCHYRGTVITEHFDGARIDENVHDDHPIRG